MQKAGVNSERLGRVNCVKGGLEGGAPLLVGWEVPGEMVFIDFILTHPLDLPVFWILSRWHVLIQKREAHPI